jgi:site-specific DNA-cytosine methylase
MRKVSNMHSTQHCGELAAAIKTYAPRGDRGGRGHEARERTRRAGTRQPGKIVDLFAGAGGWAEGLRMLGMSALGVETNEWACATAAAAGHDCLQADVAALDPLSLSPVWGLIGSPPCQAYSTAGKGLGRVDKPLVIACAHELAAGHDSRAARLSECADSRLLLTVEPLRFALEQVPAVLELWTIFAGLLAVHGYHTAAGVLSAERYGVPQTRKRAFLLASLDGPVTLPATTHRSYNPRRKETPPQEAALKPWVSMAEALGWQAGDRVGFPRRKDTPGNQPSKHDTGTYRSRDRRPGTQPAPRLTSRTRSWTRKPCVQIRRSGQRIAEGFDSTAARKPSRAESTAGKRMTLTRGRRGPLRTERSSSASSRRARASSAVAGHGVTAPTRTPRSATASTRRRPFSSGTAPTPWSGCPPRLSRDRAARGRGKSRSQRRRCSPSGSQREPPHGRARGQRPPLHATGAYTHPATSTTPATRRGATSSGAARTRSESRSSKPQSCRTSPPTTPGRGARTRQFEQVGNAVPAPLAHRVLQQAVAPSMSGPSADPKERG